MKVFYFFSSSIYSNLDLIRTARSYLNLKLMDKNKIAACLQFECFMGSVKHRLS